MAFKEIKAQEEVSPNLIPMIDIMFLLLLFFMLNADMSQRELEEVTPPEARHSTKETKENTAPDRVTVNVHHDPNIDCAVYKNAEVCRTEGHWRISVSGRSFTLDVDGMKKLETVLYELAKSKMQNPSDPKAISERTVMVRADRSAPFGYIQKVMEQTAKARMYKVEVGAGLPKSEANKQEGN
jgi:biopolymer transport protein ExbD